MMKVKIRKDASSLYSVVSEDVGWNPSWEEIFRSISGKWVEVDTDHLHKYDYYLKPIDGLFDEPILVEEDFIEKIKDDIRYGKARCDLCGNVSEDREVCSECGKSDYLEPFFDDDEEEEHKKRAMRNRR
jgi:hypothetical protein